MKVTMLTTMCGPAGNAHPGFVLDLPDAQAKEFIDRRFARKFDAERDKKPKGRALEVGHVSK